MVVRDLRIKKRKNCLAKLDFLDRSMELQERQLSNVLANGFTTKEPDGHGIGKYLKSQHLFAYSLRDVQRIAISN